MEPTFTDALNELMEGRGISNNELARQIDVDPAQIGRWRKGRGRPRPENIVSAARVLGVDHRWLWSLAYPDGMPDQSDTKEPRLAAFLAQIEAAFHALTPQEWEVRESAGHALFSVPPTRAKSPSTASAKSRQRARSTASTAAEESVNSLLEDRKRRVRFLAPALAY